MPAILQGESSSKGPRIGAAPVAALLVLLLCVGPAYAGASTGTTPTRTTARACPGATSRPSHANAATIDAATLCLIDQLRAAHCMRALRTNGALRAVADAQVRTMVQEDYFADDRPSGTTPAALIAATGYGQRFKNVSMGENIGWGTEGFATPQQMVRGWMESPPHREIILTGEFTDIGIGVLPAVPSSLAEGQYGATYALELAKP